MKTRTKKSAPSKPPKEEQPASKIQQLEPSVSNPPKVFILPRNTSPDARIVTLPNPATSTPSRYLICPERGFYEFTRIAAPKRACRSWLLAPERNDTSTVEATTESQDGAEMNDQAYILQTPELLLATPIDPLFLLLPDLAQTSLKGSVQMFLTLFDYIDILEERSAQFKEVMRLDRLSGSRLQRVLERRIMAVCVEMEAGDERLYKLSHEKLSSVLWAKARNMVQRGLPPSMEERFVKQALVVPVMSVKREESNISMAVDGDAEEGASQSQAVSAGTEDETQDSMATTASVSTAATSITETPAEDADEKDKEMRRLLRLRTAYNFLTTSYIPSTLRSTLSALPTPVNFTILDAHLAHIAKLKSEAQALRSMSDNITRKRGLDEDDGEALEREEKKRKKKEEEEFKKKNVSQGVKRLAKVDVGGMKKMSSFFGKAAVKK